MDTAANAQAGTPARTALSPDDHRRLPRADPRPPLPPAAYFEFDSAALDAPDNNTLRELATCPTRPLAGRKVELVGHADAAGTDDYDEQLGRSRAESVQDFLRRQGVTEDMLVTRSEGEQMAPQAPPRNGPTIAASRSACSGVSPHQASASCRIMPHHAASVAARRSSQTEGPRSATPCDGTNRTGRSRSSSALTHAL